MRYFLAQHFCACAPSCLFAGARGAFLTHTVTSFRKLRSTHGVNDIRVPCGGEPQRSFRSHALRQQLLHRALVLGQVRQPHTSQHARCFCELNVFVLNDFDPVSPGIEEIKKRTGQYRYPGLRKSRANGLLVIDHWPESDDRRRGPVRVPSVMREIDRPNR